MAEIDAGVWSRQDILNACDLLDALDEAREDEAAEAKKAAEKK